MRKASFQSTGRWLLDANTKEQFLVNQVVLVDLDDRVDRVDEKNMSQSIILLEQGVTKCNK